MPKQPKTKIKIDCFKTYFNKGNANVRIFKNRKCFLRNKALNDYSGYFLQNSKYYPGYKSWSLYYESPEYLSGLEIEFINKDIHEIYEIEKLYLDKIKKIMKNTSLFMSYAKNFNPDSPDYNEKNFAEVLNYMKVVLGKEPSSTYREWALKLVESLEENSDENIKTKQKLVRIRSLDFLIELQEKVIPELREKCMEINENNKKSLQTLNEKYEAKKISDKEYTEAYISINKNMVMIQKYWVDQTVKILGLPVLKDIVGVFGFENENINMVIKEDDKSKKDKKQKKLDDEADMLLKEIL